MPRHSIYKVFPLILSAVIVAGCSANPSPHVSPSKRAASASPAWYVELQGKLGQNFLAPLAQVTKPFSPTDGPHDLPVIGIQIAAEWDGLLKPIGKATDLQFRMSFVTDRPSDDPCAQTEADVKGKISSCQASSTDSQGSMLDFEVPSRAFDSAMAQLQNSPLSATTQLNADVLVAMAYAQYITARLGDTVASIPQLGSVAPEPVYRLAGMSLRAVLPSSVSSADFADGFHLVDELLEAPYAGSADVQEQRRAWLVAGFTQGTLATCMKSIH